MANKIVIAIVISLLLSGCGGVGPGQTPNIVHADSFPVAQPLTCSGPAGNQSCDFSDGSSYYRHDQTSFNVRPDGHGTFQIVTESGISHDTNLFQIQFPFPQQINIAEVHATLSITSWCNGNGVVTTWDSLAPGAAGSIVGGKTMQFKTGDVGDFVIPQVLFPQPIPASQLQMNIYTDLCASSTVHWVMNGSF